MKMERLIQLALHQSLIICVVCGAIPIIGVVATLLLSALSSLLCEQLNGLMILSVVVTASTLVVQQFRRDTSA